jgi:dihydrolipoamide dehydrogenase
MQRKKVDVVVLGAGPGGYPTAIRLSQAGKKVALIEAKEVGGTCLNRGCIPTKTLLKSVMTLTEIKRSGDFGLKAADAKVDWPQLVAKKDAVVTGLRKSLEGLIQSNGIDLIYGFGKFISPKEIEISGNTPMVIQAEHVVIATGSEPKQIPSIPFDHEFIYSSTSILDLKKIPKTITVIGGGANGCEFASMFSGLGVKVYIVEMLPRILPLESHVVSTAVTQAFIKEGIEIFCSEKVMGMRKTDDGVETTLGNGKVLHTSIAMVAAGRALNTDAIGLSAIGVKTDRGVIPTDDRMSTNIDGIWAIGDITARYLYAHVATHQGLVAAENILGRRKKMYYNAIPGALFTRPEVGSVGYSLEEAQKNGFAAKSATFPLQALGRAHASCHTEGFVQLVFEPSTGRILGAQAVGYHAAELIAEMGLAITNELTLECVTETIHAHPTFAESWPEAAFIAEGEPLHFPKQQLSSVLRGA